jgi:hypothetical protein
VTDFDVVIAKLDAQHDILDKYGHRMDKMEAVLGKMGIATTMISNAQLQIDALWRKNDENYGPGGVVTKIKTHQMQCPKPQITRLWWAIGLLATVHAATLSFVFSVALKGT